MSRAEFQPGDRIVRVGGADVSKTKGTVRRVKYLGQSAGATTGAYVLLGVKWDREPSDRIAQGQWIAVHHVRKISALEELAETYEE